MTTESKAKAKAEEKEVKSISLEELKEKYANYFSQYEKAIKFINKLEGVLEYLAGQIKELTDEENDK